MVKILCQIICAHAHTFTLKQHESIMTYSFIIVVGIWIVYFPFDDILLLAKKLSLILFFYETHKLSRMSFF